MASFNFGSGAGAGSNTPKQPLFGANTTTSEGATPSPFGATANNHANTGSSTPGSQPAFGGTLFNADSASATPASKPSLFGANQATAGAPQSGSNTPFSFGNPAGAGNAGVNTTSTPKPSPFGTGGTGGTSAPSFSFGQTAAFTPAAKPTFQLTSSTTPAGPPPGTRAFGGQNTQLDTGSQQSSSSLFAPRPAITSASSTPQFFAPAASSSTPAKPLGGAPSSGLTGFGFGNKDTSTDANKSTPGQQAPAAPISTLFGGGAASGTAGTQPAQATPKAPLFALGSTTPASTPASKPPTFSLGATPASSQLAQPAARSATPANPLSFGANKSTPASTGAPASGMFSNLGSGSSGSSGGSSFLKPPASSSGFTPAPSGPTTTTGGASSSTAAPTLFSGLGGSSTAASSGTASGNAPASSLFNLGSKQADTTTQPSASTTTTAPAAATSGSGTTTILGTASGTTAADAGKSGLAASTAGPAPSTQSRLKNKSMDEIITRWAADLSKYQKEFQAQAEQVAAWDRSLVENSNKVKQLFTKTYEAERDAGEVERQLRLMEENQQELDTYLDRYEKEVDNLMKMHGVSGQGRADGLRSGPDQERERTYKLAEKLQDRLNELNKDLTEMIEEINNTSQTLSKSGKPDDPLTKVVRVLNSQLSQLQLIDSGASQLQEKINQAQKEHSRIGANGWNGLGTDPADDFYRSLRGGRTDRFGGVS